MTFYLRSKQINTIIRSLAELPLEIITEGQDKMTGMLTEVSHLIATNCAVINVKYSSPESISQAAQQ